MARNRRLPPDDDHARAESDETDAVSKQEARTGMHTAASRRPRQDEIRTLSVAAQERYANLLDRLAK